MYTKPCEQCGKTILEIGLVTIPSADFETLLAKAKALDALEQPGISFRQISKTVVARDPEVARHISECRQTMIGREIRSSCQDKFGKSRTPSISAIYRFLNDLSKTDRRTLKSASNPIE